MLFSLVLSLSLRSLRVLPLRYARGKSLRCCDWATWRLCLARARHRCTAFHNLLATQKNQSMIVCGESGSGKTESAKHLMRYLAFVDKASL